MLQSVFLFFFGLILLWIGSGFAVNAIVKISKKIHIKSFYVSFFVLGLFTSMTEIMVGVNAVLSNEPEIFVGNLIGSSVVVFLCIIPFLAVFGKGVNLHHTLKFRDLITAVIVVGIPAFLTLDNTISIIDAFICIVFYGYFFYNQGKYVHAQKTLKKTATIKKILSFELLQVCLSVIIVFAASKLLVQETVHIGKLIGISPYIISIVVLSLGTNIPELAIAVRSLFEKQKDIAFGNYVGSASLNTLEMGILTLISGKTIVADGSNFSILAFLTGLLLFIRFGRSRNTISRKEGYILLCGYVLFMFFEVFTGPGWRL